MKLLLRVLVFSSAIYVAYCLCNACSALTSVACVSNNMLKICLNGLPTGQAIACPEGTVCSESAQICTAAGSVPPACDLCGQCNGTNTFACTGYNTFALCYGSSFPSSTNFTCPASLVCNIDSPQMCIDPTTTGIGGTCPSVSGTTTTTTSSTAATITTTTPNPAVAPQAYCTAKATVGRFDVTSDTTCKTYIYCTLYNSAWVGGLYQCVGKTLFNASSGLCEVGTPTRCAAAVASLDTFDLRESTELE